MDVVVIGGGLMGLSVAYHLVRDGAKVLLVDRKDPGRATDVGVGVLSPETNTRDDDVWFALAHRGVRYYPTLCEHLEADGAGETGYSRCGVLIPFVSAEELPEFEEERRFIHDRYRRHGLSIEEDLRELDGQEARAFFPPLSTVVKALHARSGARVDGQLLTAALAKAAERRGLQVERPAVGRLELDGDRVRGVTVETGGGSRFVPSRWVVIAGGAWSPAVADGLGVPVMVEPQRGQIVELRLAGPSKPAVSAWDTGAWPLVKGRRGHYLVAWPGGRVVAGATRETGSGFDVRATAGGVSQVLEEGLRVASGLAAAELVKIGVGLRPVTPDGLPLLGGVPGVEGVILATGHGPTGLQAGPYSGKLIADLIAGREADLNLEPYSIKRFDGDQAVG